MDAPLGLGAAARGGLGAATAANASPAKTGNEAWALKKAPVGLKLLQKMGWQDGKGLGANEDGNVSHIHVSRKSRGMGVGVTADDIKRGWDTPAALSTGFNDVLARLAPVGSAGDAHNADTQPPGPPAASAPRKRAAGRGFYERKRALKTVGKYSKQELAEIFGGSGGGSGEDGGDGAGGLGTETSSGLDSASSDGNSNSGENKNAGLGVNAQRRVKIEQPGAEDGDDGKDVTGNGAQIDDSDEEDGDTDKDAVVTGATKSAAERALSTKKRKEEKSCSTIDKVRDGEVKKKKKKKKKEKKLKKNKKEEGLKKER